MKKSITKIWSLLLASVMLVNLFQIIMVQASGESTGNAPGANIISARLSLKENYKLYDNGVGTYWQIELTADENIGFGKSSYWHTNLQQYMVESQSTDTVNWEEHNALADKLRQLIFINGAPLQEGMDKDPVNTGLCVRIQAGDEQYETTRNKLIINVRAEFAAQLDNALNVNDYSDFTLEFKEGLILNGFQINPVKYKYQASSQEMFIDNGKADIVESGVSFDKKVNELQYHVFSLKTRFNIETSDGKELQNGDGEITKSLCDNILINGKTIAEGLKMSSDHDKSTLIWTGTNAEGDSENLYIAVKTDDNPYNFSSASEFSFEIKKGIVLGDYSLQPQKFKFSLETGRLIADDGSAEFTSAVLSDVISYKTGGTERGPCWVITLETPADIKITDKNGNYWNQNLQQMMASSQGEFYAQHNSQAQLLRNKITINGVKIDTMLSATDECATSITTPDSNHIKIYINKRKDTYGISSSGKFTVQLLKGLEISDVAISPITFTYDGEKEAFSIDGSANTDKIDPNSASVDTVTLETANKTCSCGYDAGDSYRITINFDKNIYDKNIKAVSGRPQTDYYTKHLLSDGWSSPNTSSYSQFRKFILINGKSLEECMAEETVNNDWSKLVHLETISSSNKKLILTIPKNNTFGVGNEPFTVSILDGFIMNKRIINPVKIICNPSDSLTELTEVTSEEIFSATSANALGATLAEQETKYCSNHPDDPQWIISIKFDKSMYGQDVYSPAPGGSGYYRRHLQATGWTATANAESSVSTIRECIKLNDMTLADCFEKCVDEPYNDQTCFVHLDVNSLNENVIKLAVPTDNTFGFNADKDFTVSFLKGLRINGYKIQPFMLSYDKNTGEFTMKNPSEAKVTGVSLETENNKTFVISLETDRDISVTGGVSGDLQFVDRQRSVERKELARQLIKNITLNGETLEESIERAGQHYTARVSAAGNKLQLRVSMKTPTTYDNDFYISDKTDFTIAVKEKLNILGVSVDSGRWKYNADSGSFTEAVGEDIKNINQPVLGFTGKTREQTDNSGNKTGILLWTGGTSRYVDFYVDCLIRGTSMNSEIFNNAHGESVRKNIYVDGMTVDEWLEYGNQYQVMIRFEGNYIRFLLDGSRMPDMIEDEPHWIEFKEGVISASGEKVSACKFYYSPKARVWTTVESFDGCEKPWWVENYEQMTDKVNNGWTPNPDYNRPQFNWNDGVITSFENDNSDKKQPGSNTNDNNFNNKGENNTANGGEETKKKVIVKKRKVIPGDVTYEYYLPVWAIVLIAAGGVILVGGTVTLIVVKRKKKKKLCEELTADP